MRVRYYVASALANIERVRRAEAYLDTLGWRSTYKWSNVGEVSMDQYSDIAMRELDGVHRCDIFIMLQPGKFGSYTELGAALSDPNKRIYVIGRTEDQNKMSDGRYPSIFLYHPRVKRINLDNLNKLSKSDDYITALESIYLEEQ